MIWPYLEAAVLIFWPLCAYIGHELDGDRPFSGYDVIGGFFMAVILVLILAAFVAWVALLVNA